MPDFTTQSFAVWIEAVTTREDRFQSALIRLGVPGDEAVGLSRRAPCLFRGQLTLAGAEELKDQLREAGARVIVRVEHRAASDPGTRIAVGTTPPPMKRRVEAPFALDAVLELPELPALPACDPLMIDTAAPPIVGVLELDDGPRQFARGAVSLPAAMTGITDVPANVDPVTVDPRARTVAATIELGEQRARPGKALTATLAPELPVGADGRVVKPEAVWTPPSTKGMRIFGAVAAVVFSLTMTHCVAHYRVQDRMHDFSATADETFERELMMIGRTEQRPANARDLQAAATRAAAATGVKMKVLGVTEIRMITVNDGLNKRGRPERNPGLPHEFLLRLNLRNTAGDAPSWIVGVRAEITAQSLWVKRTRYVEQWAFADNYVGIDGRHSLDNWIDVEKMQELLPMLPMLPTQ